MWHPYEAEFSHLPEFCVAGRDKWIARVPIVCFSIVERHHPDCVLQQFGLAQQPPDDVVYDDRLYRIDLRGKVEKNWRDEHRLSILEWDMRQQQICHALPQIGEMPRDHAYYRRYRPVTRKYVDRNSAKLDIMVMCSENDFIGCFVFLEYMYDMNVESIYLLFQQIWFDLTNIHLKTFCYI